MCMTGNCIHEGPDGECSFARCPWKEEERVVDEAMDDCLADAGRVLDCGLRRIGREDFAVLAEGLDGMDALCEAVGVDPDGDGGLAFGGPLSFADGEDALAFLEDAESEAESLLSWLRERQGGVWKDTLQKNPLRRLLVQLAATASWHRDRLEASLGEIEGWMKF